MDSGIDAEPTAVVDAQSSEAERVPEPSEDAEVDADQPDSVNVGNDHDDDAGGEEAAGSNDHLAGGAEPSAPFADEATVASSQPEESDQSDCCRPAEHDQPDSGQPAEIQSHSGEPAQGQPSVSTEPDEPQVTAEAVADDGEIVSDSEAADGGPNGGAPDEADSTTASIAVEQPSDVSASQLPEPASSTLQKRQHDADGLTNDSNSDNAGVREPQTKKSALEHLRNMKFSKTDPFNDSANSLRFNREDADANARRKRPPADDERDRRRSRYRHGVSPSSHVSSSTDHHNNGGGVADQQKRQRSTMYFLMQSGEQPPVAAQSPAHAFHHHHNLPASLKGVLQTSGHLRQKLESLLSLKDDQVFGLPAEDMECLLMYTFELSMEQDRLLAGRKAQLKQLDQMIQKERDHMDRLVQELPGHARPNVGEMLNGKSPNAARNSLT